MHFLIRRPLIWLGILGLSWHFVAGQENKAVEPAQNTAVPTLHVTTRMVTVDVVAKDRHAKLVPGLTAKDFQVFEQVPSKRGEHEQKIAGFLAVDRAAIAAAAKQNPDKMPAGVYSNLVTTRLSVPPTILLLDGLNTEGDSGLQARRQMVKMLASIPPDTPVAVFILGNELTLLQSFTKDPKQLRDAAARVMTTNIDNGGLGIDPHDDPNSLSNQAQEMFGGDDEAATTTTAPQGGRGTSGGVGPSGPVGGELQMAEIRRFEKETFAANTDMRVRQTLDALRAIARHVSGYPGRKNLIWISSSFPMTVSPDALAAHHLGFEGTRNYEDLVAVATTALADAKIAVYPVNPAGVQTQSYFSATKAPKTFTYGESTTGELKSINRESLARFSGVESMTEVAQQTGGAICINNNDLGDCVKTAVDEGSSYYELAYYPDAGNWHGEFHRILVKSTRPGVQLSFRGGYYARENDANAARKEKAGNDPQLQEAACQDLLTATSVLLVARAMPAEKPSQATYYLGVDSRMLTFSAAENGQRELHMDVAVCAFDRAGKPVQYFQENVDQKFEAKDLAAMRGVPRMIEFTPKEGTLRVRLVVRDVATGKLGSVELPYVAPAKEAATAPPAPPATN
jgi:VWFA-related protein